MNDLPRAPGAMGIMAQSLAEARKPLGRATLEKPLASLMSQPIVKPVDAKASPAPVVSPPSPSQEAIEEEVVQETKFNVREKKADDQIYLVEARLIRPWKLADRPKCEFGDLDALTESIRNQGQELPILVRPNRSGSAAKYEAIYGVRRLTVCQDLGIKVKAFVRDIDDQEAFKRMYLENNRNDISPWARAISWKTAIDNGVYPSESALAAHLGVHRATVSSMMAYTRIDPKIIAELGEETLSKMSVRTAKAILAASHEDSGVDKVLAIKDKIIAGKISGDRITAVASRDAEQSPRETKIITSPDGKKLFSCRVTNRGLTEIMLYPDAVKDKSVDDLIAKIKNII